MKSSSEYGKYVTAARYIGFGVNELTEENGQTVSRTFQGFPIVNTEQTFPVEFSLDIDSQRECPKRATIYVPGNDTQGSVFEPKFSGQGELTFGSYTTIPVAVPKF